MTDKQEITLPVFINGQPYTCDDLPDSYTLDYESGLSIRLPAIKEDFFKDLAARRYNLLTELTRLTLYDITMFLSEVGKRWSEPDYKVRLEAEERASLVTGYTRRMIQTDYAFIGLVLKKRHYIWDFVASELGGEFVMDEWCRIQSAWVRAFPQGVVLHCLVGNLPLANSFSIIWGCLTKNINVAKLPARDPVTPLALAAAFHDVDPDHPITRALTVAYWPRESPLAQTAYHSANVVCAWGGAPAIKRIKEQVPAGVPVLEFGPKWSLAVVDLDRSDTERTAWRMAAEVTYYDQEACLSPQRLFVKGDVKKWLERLRHYLDIAARHMPKETWNQDALAHNAFTRLEASYRGWDIHTGQGWTVIEVDDPAEVVDHPLGRTLFVHKVESISDVAQYINPSTQVVCCHPWELGEEHRDEWAIAGAVRFVELGLSRMPQHGVIHDGMRPLSRLVRWVCHEKGLNYFYKYGEFNPEQLEEHYFFKR